MIETFIFFIRLITLILGLLVVLIGVSIFIKCAGKFKMFVASLLFGVLLIAVKKMVFLVGDSTINFITLSRVSFDFFITLSIFIGFILLRQIVFSNANTKAVANRTQVQSSNRSKKIEFYS